MWESGRGWMESNKVSSSYRFFLCSTLTVKYNTVKMLTID